MNIFAKHRSWQRRESSCHAVQRKHAMGRKGLLSRVFTFKGKRFTCVSVMKKGGFGHLGLNVKNLKCAAPRQEPPPNQTKPVSIVPSAAPGSISSFSSFQKNLPGEDLQGKSDTLCMTPPPSLNPQVNPRRLPRSKDLLSHRGFDRSTPGLNPWLSRS